MLKATTSTEDPASNPAARNARLLLAALGSDRHAASLLARAWEVADEGSWSPIDIVVQNRRRCAALGDERSLTKLHVIDDTIAQTWVAAIDSFDAATTAPQADLALKALGQLTERIPAPQIHRALYSAILAAGCILNATSAEQYEQTRRRLASVLVPTWHKTLDRATHAQMKSVLEKRVLFAQGDYFVGWIWAWRFGIDRAVDYLGALAEVKRADTGQLPLASDEDCEFFRRLILGTTSISVGEGYEEMLGGIFQALRRAPSLHGWKSWISDCLVAAPTVLEMVAPPTDALIDPALVELWTGDDPMLPIEEGDLQRTIRPGKD